MKIKLKDANLYNCEGFMTDMELVDKINNVFKTDTDVGMTDGEVMFTKSEVDKVIKYLAAFDLTLNQMVVANKSKRYYGEVRQVQTTNLDTGVSKVEIGRDLTDAEVDKAFEETEAWQDIIDKENTTLAGTQ